MLDFYFKTLPLIMAGISLIISCTTLVVVYITYKDTTNSIMNVKKLREDDLIIKKDGKKNK